MGISPGQPTGSPAASSLAHLDDAALIRRYCTALATKTTDEDAVQELWQHRHGPILLQKIKYLAAKAGDLRPDFVDFKPFVDASWNWAWQKYFRYICTVENPGSKAALNQWLERVAFSAIGEERRQLRGRIVERGAVPLDELAGEEGGVPKEEYESGKEQGSRVISRPGLERQPSAPVLIAGKQRKFILRELLILHAQSSERARESAHFVRLYHWKDWKCPQIARHYYPNPADEMQKKADDHRVWARLQSDHEKLRKLLKKEFKVASLRQI